MSITPRILTLLPANGREYNTKEAIKKAWNSNKDFIVDCPGTRLDSKYLSKRDLEDLCNAYEDWLKYSIVRFRYNKNKTTCLLAELGK